MHYKELDMQTYKRKDHFAYFCGLAYPYAGITVNVDITDLLEKVRTEKTSFFLTICYCVAKAANGIPEFRQRIMDGKIIEFDHCRTSHTVALEDGTYCYCTLEDMMPFVDYLAYAQKEQERAKAAKSFEETQEETADLFFISTLPWVSYSAIVQPVPMPADSNPRITWGKYFTQGGRVLLPVSVLCHHALVDGRHLADFYQLLEDAFRQL